MLKQFGEALMLTFMLGWGWQIGAWVGLLLIAFVLRGFEPVGDGQNFNTFRMSIPLGLFCAAVHLAMQSREWEEKYKNSQHALLEQLSKRTNEKAT